MDNLLQIIAALAALSVPQLIAVTAVLFSAAMLVHGGKLISLLKPKAARVQTTRPRRRRR